VTGLEYAGDCRIQAARVGQQDSFVVATEVVAPTPVLQNPGKRKTSKSAVPKKKAAKKQGKKKKHGLGAEDEEEEGDTEGETEEEEDEEEDDDAELEGEEEADDEEEGGDKEEEEEPNPAKGKKEKEAVLTFEAAYGHRWDTVLAFAKERLAATEDDVHGGSCNKRYVASYVASKEVLLSAFDDFLTTFTPPSGKRAVVLDTIPEHVALLAVAVAFPPIQP
jgi:hypothetical protein